MIELSTLQLRFHKGCDLSSGTQQWLLTTLGIEFRSHDPCQGFSVHDALKRLLCLFPSQELNNYSEVVLKLTHIYMHTYTHTPLRSTYKLFA